MLGVKPGSAIARASVEAARGTGPPKLARRQDARKDAGRLGDTRVFDLDVRALWALYGGMHGAWAPVMIGFTILGAGWTALLLVPLLWHAKTRPFAVPLALAVLATAVLVWAIKAAVGRVRPWIALGLPAPISRPHDGSFPSGHAAGSFCVAVFLALTIPVVWKGSRTSARVLAALALVIAALIGLSRVYLGAHFPSDVAAGALLGALIGAAGAGFYTSRAR
jgi:undecaprenyl-diphosphatase